MDFGSLMVGVIVILIIVAFIKFKKNKKKTKDDPMDRLLDAAKIADSSYKSKYIKK